MNLKVILTLFILVLILFEAVESRRSGRNTRGGKCPYSTVDFSSLSKEKSIFGRSYDSLKDIISSIFFENNGVLWPSDDDSLDAITILPAGTVGTGYCPPAGPVTCDPSAPYRTADGTCNNLDHPTWGMANECQLRLLPPAYEGINDFRVSVLDGRPLPEPRDLSIAIMPVADRPIPQLTFLAALLGQFAAHDVVQTPTTTRNWYTCCPYNAENQARGECAPIAARPDDPYYSQFNNTCINFERSLNCSTCDSTTEKTQKPNRLTAVLDLSMVYGNTAEQADALRAKDGTGKLRTNTSDGQGELMPTNVGTFSEFCTLELVDKCFFAGDDRVDQHAGLTSLHTSFLRHHNRMAEALKQLNPGWGEEKLYQEARKICGGQWQHIIYSEYLPHVVGPRHMKHFNLEVGQSPRYNASVRPGILLEFSTAGYRLHSLVTRLTGLSGVRFFETYMTPGLVREGCVDGLVQGASRVPPQQFDRFFEEDVNGQFNRLPGEKFGLDSSSVDIQRGRDHGMPSYPDVVKVLTAGQTDIATFDDLLPLMEPEGVRLLRENYESVFDIDLWVGLQLEKHPPGSILGFNSATLSAMQYHTNKFGDRFYYEFTGPGAAFTQDQIAALKTITLSRILCDTIGIQTIQKNPLLMPGNENPVLSCDKIPKMDLTPWKTNA